MQLKVKKLDKEAVIPTKTHKYDAGFDLYSLEDKELYSGKIGKIRTGIAVEIPDGYVGIIHDRSSMGSKGYKVMGGVIDATYRGEIFICLALVDCGGAYTYVTKIEKIKKSPKLYFTKSRKSI